MNKYNLYFTMNYTDKRIVMEITADSFESACIIGDTLADQMPTEAVWFDKNNDWIEESWSCFPAEVESL